MENEKKYEKKWNYTFILFASLMIAAFVVLGFCVWYEYRNTLLQRQKEDLLVISETLGKNMESSLNEYCDELDFLCQIENTGMGTDELFRWYVETNDSLECNILWEDEKGNIEKSIKNIRVEERILLTEIDKNRSIYQYTCEKQHYLVFKQQLLSGKIMSLVIDENTYYEKLISDIHIGTNGYFVIKNADGVIIMHPDEEQWGLEVIEGRKNIYPSLDLSSLEKMVEQQMRGEVGVSEYYSYWWVDKPELAMVKKVAAYVPIEIGESFWIVSAVVDYDDFYNPIQEGFAKLVGIFICILIFFVGLIFNIVRLSVERRKAYAEIVYLRELNELLEEVHRGEENLAHQQRLQIMGTMTGGITHEFNNFLTPIMGYAEMLLMELPQESQEQGYAREIYEAAEKAEDVIRQLSSLSRKNIETVYKGITMKKFLLRAVKMIKSVCPTQISLQVQIDLSEEMILGNVTQMNQVILNIAMNAIQAIGRNEGVICIRAKCVDIEELREMTQIPLSETWKRYIKIDIKDNGCGMDNEILRQIFDPFFTTKKGGEGTGLGLALVEQIVRTHKGYIYAESEKGGGSVFYMILPVMEHNMEVEQLWRREKQDWRILIADDNAKILRILTKNFAKIGQQIYTFRYKEELLRDLEKNKADVLVIDESIGDVGGIEFCMSIYGKYPDLIKILMVDSITREIVEAKQRNIIDGYIEKPVSDTAILETIRECIAK